MATKKLTLLLEQLDFLVKHNASKDEIKEIEDKIIRSKRATKSRRKGASYEVKIAEKFNKRFPCLDMVKTPSSGGFQKSSSNEEIRGDISNLNKGVRLMLHIECKNQKTWKLKDWLEQAEGDCPSDKVPLVIFHKQQEIESNKVTQKSEDYVALRLNDLFNIIKDESVIRELVTVAKEHSKNEEKPNKAKGNSNSNKHTTKQIKRSSQK